MCDIGIDCDSELGLRTMYTYIHIYMYIDRNV